MREKNLVTHLADSGHFEREKLSYALGGRWPF